MGTQRLQLARGLLSVVVQSCGLVGQRGTVRGGPIPSTWECLHTEAIGSGWVRVWYKARVGPIELYWMEHD
ncbi:MAG TPA: hypothetical protein PKX25_07445, partial [Microthrixaceae bacterium]|nr:hypothetical protein [Microthrixaceae bacterium]